MDSRVWSRISDQTPAENNQTSVLLSRYEKQFGKTEEWKLLDEVGLSVPENIHLNSFMYEPILDMSDIHLKDLYQRVTGLYE